MVQIRKLNIKRSQANDAFVEALTLTAHTRIEPSLALSVYPCSHKPLQGQRAFFPEIISRPATAALSPPKLLNPIRLKPAQTIRHSQPEKW